jgi:hypothetical protein
MTKLITKCQRILQMPCLKALVMSSANKLMMKYFKIKNAFSNISLKIVNLFSYLRTHSFTALGHLFVKVECKNFEGLMQGALPMNLSP